MHVERTQVRETNSVYVCVYMDQRAETYTSVEVDQLDPSFNHE